MRDKEKITESDIAEILLASMVGGGSRQTPVGIQVSLFGFTPRTLKSLKGKSVLDVACGDGSMVKYLRSAGVNAEGMDSSAPASHPYFIKKDVTGMDKTKGIPRPDGSYDIVTTFQNTTINSAFEFSDIMAKAAIFEGRSNEDLNSVHIEAQSTILEMVRVAKPGGKVMIFPFIPQIKEVMGLSLSGYKVTFSEERIENSLIRDWLNWEHTQIPIPLPEVSDERLSLYNKRMTIIPRA
jgi:SAM-dependent methyltransferase